MKQTTIPGCGLDPVVPIGPHRDDEVLCSDDTVLKGIDVLYDVSGNAHSNEKDRFDAEVDIVEDILKNHETWCNEYTGGGYNTDYGDGYSYIVSEVHHDWPGPIEEWVLSDSGDQLCGYADLDKIVDEMCIDIDDWESIYHPSKYAAYNGPGICLYSMEIGEYANQIELSAHDELSELYKSGRLEEILHKLDDSRGWCLDRMSRWDRVAKRREYTDYVSHGHITATFYPDGQWQYVVTEETAKTALARAICQVCKNLDEPIA